MRRKARDLLHGFHGMAVEIAEQRIEHLTGRWMKRRHILLNENEPFRMPQAAVEHCTVHRRDAILPREKLGSHAARTGAELEPVTALPQRRAMEPQMLTEMAAASGFAPFGVVDGKVLPKQLIETFAAGEQAPVPLLAGFNSGEIRSLAFLASPP